MSDLVGQHLGQYQILERIARGATSTVYKAYQEKLDRYVAIKVLSPHFVDEEGFLERFHQEARAIARLDHPNILPVYDFDEVGDLVYIVMKYVTSGTLKDLMHGPLELPLVTEIATQVGLALGYAHRQGLVHRDVKPSNILLADNNWALLTDFGLAKILEMSRQLTRSGVGVGTPDYMAPEQAQGLPVDGRADLYSLGVMLFEMVTGRLPFEGESGFSVAVKHIHDPVPRPRSFQPDLPPAVEQVILKALAKDPAGRYPTAESLITALTRAAGPVPGVAGAEAAAITATEPKTDLAPSRVALIVSGARFAAVRARAARQTAVVQRRASELTTSLQVAGGARFAAVQARATRQTAAVRRRTSELTASVRVAGGRSRERITHSAAALAASLTRWTNDFRETSLPRWRSQLQSHQRTFAIGGGLLVLLLIVLAAMPAVLPSAPGTNLSTPTSVSIFIAATSPATKAARSPTGTPRAAEPTALPGVGAATIGATSAAPALATAPAGMVSVPAGSFKMGATSGKFDADETPPHIVYLDSFYMDAGSVTNAQFARFADATGYQTDAEKAHDQTTWRTYNTPDRQTFPVTFVSWNDAVRYCAWAGKRLPTEAEWEKAARGNTGNIYPWGNDFNTDYANTVDAGIGQPVATGSRSAPGPYGALDMVGNVWEFVQDWYNGGYYTDSPASNPAGPATGIKRVIRGGSFKTRPADATTTVRGQISSDARGDDIGFRCAKSATD